MNPANRKTNFNNCEWPNGANNPALPFLATDGGQRADAVGPNRYNPRGLPLVGYDPGTNALLHSRSPQDRPIAVETGGLLPQIVTPSQMRADMDKVHTYISALNEETIRSGWADRKPAFWDSWEKFLQEWYTFRAKNYDNFWSTASTMDQTDDFQRRAELWRKQWEAYGASFHTPSLPPPEVPAQQLENVIEKAGNVSLGIGYVAIGLGIVAASYYAFKILK